MCVRARTRNMRVFSDEVMAVVDITYGNSSAAEVVKELEKSGRVLIQKGGAARSMLYLCDGKGVRIYLANMSSELVKKHLNTEGFLFL